MTQDMPQPLPLDQLEASAKLPPAVETENLEEDHGVSLLLAKGFACRISLKDYERVIQHKWYKTNNGYARGHLRGTPAVSKVYLHRFIMNAPKGIEIDHIDRNPLNNRRCNLRECTRQQNAFNTGKYKKKTSSRFLGVCFDKAKNKFMASARKFKRNHFLGYFANEADAAAAYNAFVLSTRGDFASTNSIP